MGKSLPPSIKHTSPNKVIALPRQGLGASDIGRRLKDSRSWDQAKKKANPQTCNRARKVAAKNNSTSQVTQSTSARQTWVQQGVFPPRFESVWDAAVGTCAVGSQFRDQDGEPTAAGRLAGRAVGRGVRAKSIFRSDETCLD